MALRAEGEADDEYIGENLILQGESGISYSDMFR